MNLTQTNSCIYTGWVRHRRFSPIYHEFKYPLFMCFLDCDELEKLIRSRWYCGYEKFNWVSFRTTDYLTSHIKDQEHPKDRVIRTVQENALKNNLIYPNITKVCMLTHLRYLGFIFNPVSFYYCYDQHNKLNTIVAEITNTPWLERHAYFMQIGQSHDHMNYITPKKQSIKHTFKFSKAFHISPFNPMGMHYHWNFLEPSDQCLVHMVCSQENKESKQKDKHFDATLCMQRKPISDFGKTLARFPAISLTVVMGIYWQAFKLKLKRSPFYPHPNTITQ